MKHKIAAQDGTTGTNATSEIETLWSDIRGTVAWMRSYPDGSALASIPGLRDAMHDHADRIESAAKSGDVDGFRAEVRASATWLRSPEVYYLVARDPGSPGMFSMRADMLDAASGFRSTDRSAPERV